MAAWFFTATPYAADTIDCKSPWLARPLQIASLRLYRALCFLSPTEWLLVRTKSPILGRDSFEVDTTFCSTYAIAQVDYLGREGCWSFRTFGIPPVSVPYGYIGGMEWKAYDAQGRRVKFPLPSGRYYLRRWKDGAYQTRDTVVVR